jgi:hypothetical protein
MSRAALFYRKRSDSIGKPLRCLVIFRTKSSLEACGSTTGRSIVNKSTALTELSCKVDASRRVVRGEFETLGLLG